MWKQDYTGTASCAVKATVQLQYQKHPSGPGKLCRGYIGVCQPCSLHSCPVPKVVN